MSLAFLPGLLGLLSLPLIVLMHLMRERQRRMALSSLKLWSFMTPEVRGARPRRIPLTWLLALDLSIAALFSLALAQPRVAVNLPVESVTQYLLVLDTSTSMAAVDASPSRLAQARADAVALLGRLGPNDTAYVLTCAAAPAWVGTSQTHSLVELAGAVEEARPGGSGCTLADALAVGRARVDPDLALEIHVFTDGAFADPQPGEIDDPLTWHMYGSGGDNQAVMGISSAADADGAAQVFAQLVNFSDHEVTREVSFLLDGAPVASASITLPPGSVTPQVWQIDHVGETARVELAGDDLLAEDDFASIGLRQARQSRVVVAASQAGVFKRALNAIPGVAGQYYTPDEYVSQGDIDLTIFSGWLPDTLPNIPVLIVQPVDGAGAGLAQAPEALEIAPDAVVQVAGGDALAAELNFNGVRWGEVYRYPETPDAFETLVSLNMDGQSIPVLLRSQNAGQRIYLLMANIEKGNLTRHPVFPILIARCIQSAGQVSLPSQVQAGAELALPGQGEYRGLTITAPGAQPAAFQGGWPGVWRETGAAGEYRIDLETSSGELVQAYVGVNAGSMSESDITPRQWAGSGGPAAQTEAAPVAARDLKLAPWLLLLAIALLLVEATLAWR